MIDLAIGLGVPITQICLCALLAPVSIWSCSHSPKHMSWRIIVFTSLKTVAAFLLSPLSGPAFLYFRFGLSSSVLFPVSTAVCWTLESFCFKYSLPLYQVLSIRAFLNKRSEFKLLLSVNKDLNLNRYFRVIFFSGVDLLHGIPVTSYVLYFNVQRMRPYPGFASLHSTAGQIVQVPAIAWHTDTTLRFYAEFLRWATLGCSFTFVAFFTFTPDALIHYRSALSSVVKPVRSLMTSTTLSFTRSTR